VLAIAHLFLCDLNGTDIANKFLCFVNFAQWIGFGNEFLGIMWIIDYFLLDA